MRLDRPLVTLTFLSLVFACDVGIAPIAGPRVGPDGGGGDPAPEPTGGGADAGDPVEIACDDAVATGASGEHNPGRACLDCHSGGGEAPTFRLGGTVYSSLAGGAPVVGATVRVTDAGGAEHVAVSARNGNFWITEAISFPVQVSASSCPSAAPMIAPSTVGNCNASGCHDADFRIHLP
jgi:hypothetical protein